MKETKKERDSCTTNAKNAMKHCNVVIVYLGFSFHNIEKFTV